MAGCDRQDMRDLLHAYELGLLSNEQRAELERHALVCDDCFHEIESIGDAARLMNFDPETRQTIQEMTRESHAEPIRSKARVGYRVAWVPVAVVTAIALFLILKDWRVTVQPSEEAVAEENRIAVVPFENLAHPSDSSRWGDIVANLLITKLSQSPSYQIVSGQYLYDLAMRQHRPAEVSSAEAAQDLARSAKAKWLISGSVVQESPNLVATTQVVDVSSGVVQAAFSVGSREDSSVFVFVDHLSSEIEKTLGALVVSGQKENRPVSEITTTSVGAYQEYMRGLALYRQFYTSDAEPHFRAAIAADSNFAIPYYYLSLIRPIGEGRLYLEAAADRLEHAGTRDRFLIRSRMAVLANRRSEALALLREFVDRFPDEKEPLLQLGMTEYVARDYIAAAHHLEAAIALDSSFGRAYNQLAYTYDKLGDPDNAIRAIDRYIALSPGEANPFDSKAELLARNGRIKEAIASCRQALQIRPDFYPALSNLGTMYLFDEDYVRAESCFTIALQFPNPANRASGRLGLCYLPAYRGQLHDALVRVDRAMSADSADNAADHVASKLWFKAILLEAIDSLAQAREAMSLSLRLDEATAWSYRAAYLVRLSALTGKMQEAEHLADTLRRSVADSGIALTQYWVAEGAIALAKGMTDSAISLCQLAALQSDVFTDKLRLAQAYLSARRPADAVPVLELLSNSFTVARQFYVPESVKLHYYLGRAYEDLGRSANASDQYRAFLGIWRNADPDIKEVTDARDRLTRLEGES